LKKKKKSRMTQKSSGGKGFGVKKTQGDFFAAGVSGVKIKSVTSSATLKTCAAKTYDYGSAERKTLQGY
jgi:hypothetical protein